ncbi:DedA family protein [Streptomyces sp. NPDC057136]|uniref:DedA family protein n=1 Tax=Streptomyces sp. NPDC057136 TaxID=3346029 RepID=UPI003642473C
MDLAVNVLDAQSMITAFGLAGIFVIIFVETGLLVGFFLPGDSLLFLAGVGASGAAAEVFDRPGFHLSLPMLLIGTPICAVAGAQLGHLLGERIGPRLFARPDSRLFKQEYVQKAEAYLSRYGAGKAIVLARFIPVVRTFLNPVAGVLGIRAGIFFVWNTVGGLVWTVGILLLGYRLGDTLKGSIDNYLLPAVFLIIGVSMLPVLIEIVRTRRVARAEATARPAGTDAAPDGAAADRAGTGAMH